MKLSKYKSLMTFLNDPEKIHLHEYIHKCVRCTLRESGHNHYSYTIVLTAKGSCIFALGVLFESLFNAGFIYGIYLDTTDGYVAIHFI